MPGGDDPDARNGAKADESTITNWLIFIFATPKVRRNAISRGAAFTVDHHGLEWATFHLHG